MKKNYVLKTFFVFIFAFLFAYSGFFISKFNKKPQILNNLNAQANLLNIQYNRDIHLARVEIEVKDDLLIPNGKITKVIFENDELSLKPVDPRGNRGSTFLQLKPGNYTIKWFVKQNSYVYPRVKEYKQKLIITHDHLWIHVLIKGSQIDIS